MIWGTVLILVRPGKYASANVFGGLPLNFGLILGAVLVAWRWPGCSAWTPTAGRC